MDVNYGLEGTVFDIQRFSIHDGPGIRTIVFLKGCPLACKWCCNPESQSVKPVMMYQRDLCIHCGYCVEACKQGAISPQNKTFIDREKCIGCGECESVCPTGALRLKGKQMTISQVVRELKKDVSNYRHSGGGITLSGGEPLVQSEFATELLKACKLQGWHTAMETTAFTHNKQALEEVFPFVDLVLMDIKSYDDTLHQQYTGVSNAVILENAKTISAKTSVVIRVPTIPGVNATVEGISAICDFAKTLTGIQTIHLLPYHTYGENKYDLMGESYEMKDTPALSPDTLEQLKQVVENHGFRCVIGG